MPWCPACKQFAPIYERVAQFFNKGISAPDAVEPDGPRPSPPVTVFSVDCEDQARPSSQLRFPAQVIPRAVHPICPYPHSASLVMTWSLCL
jgi:thiol-disulfide isomerase/thioredoxin